MFRERLDQGCAVLMPGMLPVAVGVATGWGVGGARDETELRRDSESESSESNMGRGTSLERGSRY